MSKAHMKSEMEAASKGLRRPVPGPLHISCSFQFSFNFYGTLEYVNKWVSDSYVFSWDFFSAVGLPCPASMWLFSFILLYSICYVLSLSLRRLFFSNRHRKAVDLDGRGNREELGRAEGSETVIRIHYMRKESIFSKRGKLGWLAGSVNKDICHQAWEIHKVEWENRLPQVVFWFPYACTLWYMCMYACTHILINVIF